MNVQSPPGLPSPGAPQNETELNTNFPDHPHAQSRDYTPFSAHEYHRGQPHMYPHLLRLYPPGVPSETPYDYPPYLGAGYGPQIGGGGEYRLRRTIKLSPNAPKVLQNAARRREEAIQKSEQVNHLEGLDAAAVEELMTGWAPSPFAPPAPLASTPPQVIATPLVPSVDELFTPTVRHPTSSVEQLPTPTSRRPASPAEHLFTPTPASRRALSPLQDGDLQAAVFNALGFEPVKVPSPPSAASIPANDSGSDAGFGSEDGVGAESAKKGRPDKASEELTAQLEENINKLFETASKATGRTVDSLVSHWHRTSKYGAKQSPWNEYQHYFKKNMEKERRRAGLPDGNANACWQTFKLKPNHQRIMVISLELEKAQEDTTIAQRQKVFKKLTDAQEGLVNKAAHERVETFVFMAGSSINEDASLTFLFASEGMEEFVTKRLRMTPSDFIGLAKTQIYAHASEEFITDYVVARGDVTKPQPPHGTKQKPSQAAPIVVEDDDEGESEGEGALAHSADADRNEVKKRFSALFREHNLRTRTFLWSGLLAQLVKWRVQVVGWPADVPFPSETIKVDDEGKKKSSQGIKLLQSRPVRSLLAALADPAKPIKIVTGLSKRDLEEGKLPLIVCAAPPHGSEHPAGRRQYAGGRIESDNSPALDIATASIKPKKKGKSTIKPPPSDIDDLFLSDSPISTASTKTKKKGNSTSKPAPSNIDDLFLSDSPPCANTRSHSNPRLNHQARVESDDDDDTPLIPVHPKSTFSSASTTHVESDDSDPEGANAVDADDMEFDAPDDDQSEVEVKPKSPKKAGKVRRKAEASRSAKGKGKAKAATEVGPTMKTENTTRMAAVLTPTPVGANSASAPVDPAAPTMEDSAPAPTPAPVDPTTLSTALPHAGAARAVRTKPVPAHSKPTMEDKISRAIASLGSGRALESGDEPEPLAKRPRLEANGTTLPDGTREPPSSSLATTPLPEAGPIADLPPACTPSRAPSHAPSVPSHASSRAPSAPPRAPSAMPVTGARPLPARPPPYFYGPSDNHSLAQRPPPPGMYLRGRGAAHPPYMRRGPAGRGRNGIPQPNDGPLYYDGYLAPRPAYGREGYYTDYGESTHHSPYALPYGYTHQEAYPPYAAYGFGEAGPSRYADRHDVPNRTMAYTDENGGVDPVEKDGMDIEGWTEVNDHSSHAE